jgi:hypothetical protein
MRRAAVERRPERRVSGEGPGFKYLFSRRPGPAYPRPARHNVENRLGAHTRNRCAADVFQVQRKWVGLLVYTLPLSSEEPRPARVVLDEADDTRLKAEGVSHRCTLNGSRLALWANPTPAQAC